MKALPLGGALSAAALCLTISGHGFAYCLTRTCDPETMQCELDSTRTCIVSGKTLFWPNSCVSYDVQKDGSEKLNISYDALHTVVVDAFQKWLDADCGNGTHPSIHVADFGAVTCAKPEYNKDQPNANIITFHDQSPWPHPNAVDTLALTTVFFNGDSGEIYDANVEINSAEDSFAIGDPKGTQVDLNAVLTHEIGHFLGLSHSAFSDSTMYSSYMPGMTTLEQDDVTAICLSLPPGRTPLGTDCTPRHGFSTECGQPKTGCCATAVGSTGSQGQTLGLFAFALGLGAWGGRLRLRRSARAPRR